MTPPLQSHLPLQPNDQILADVVLGYTQKIAWPATVETARRVVWDAMPQLGAEGYREAYGGNVRFVLTHLGL